MCVTRLKIFGTEEVAHIVSHGEWTVQGYELPNYALKSNFEDGKVLDDMLTRVGVSVIQSKDGDIEQALVLSKIITGQEVQAAMYDLRRTRLQDSIKDRMDPITSEPVEPCSPSLLAPYVHAGPALSKGTTPHKCC